MKIVQINATCGVGSTGKICVGISEVLAKENIENYILYSSRSNGCACGISCSNDRYIKIQALKAKLWGNYGFNSVRATRRMIDALERIKPDIVHLHNIHGHDCDLERLFAYFKAEKTKLVWTFHDCWAFTGYCTHFVMAKCSKWQSQCTQCVQKRTYSWFADQSTKLFEKKKELFDGLDLTVVTPSRWLAGLVEQSFLKNYPVEVINNGIDLNVFRPNEGDFRRRYGLGDQKIVLGVAFGWDERKGLDVFIHLARRLPNDYKIVLVGIDGKTAKSLPEGVISIPRTQNQQELAEIYSAADLFVNPTREENYPTVNMEAIACGTPVLTFCTGGSPEMLDDTCGSVVDCDDVDALEGEIIRICTDKPYSVAQCINKAKGFHKDKRFKEYLKLYERIDAARAEGD